MNHDCKENTCPFYAVHQNEIARKHAASTFPMRHFKAVTTLLLRYASERALRRNAFGKENVAKYSPSWIEAVKAIDPKLASLMEKVNESEDELDEYILNRTVKG